MNTFISFLFVFLCWTLALWQAALMFTDSFMKKYERRGEAIGILHVVVRVLIVPVICIGSIVITGLFPGGNQ